MGSYSLAKALDMCSAFCEGCGNAANPSQLRSMKGRASWDRRNAFVASYLWAPPVKFSKHKKYGSRPKPLSPIDVVFTGCVPARRGINRPPFAGIPVSLRGIAAVSTLHRNHLINHSGLNDVVNLMPAVPRKTLHPTPGLVADVRSQTPVLPAP
jgi:hypothetical protein